MPEIDTKKEQTQERRQEKDKTAQRVDAVVFVARRWTTALGPRGVDKRMPSVFSHPAVPLAIVSAVGTRRVSLRLFLAAALFAILPDADVIGFRFGIPYDHLLGHRGFFHSPIFACIASLTGALAYRALRSTYRTAFIVLFISLLMHGILDAATNGGRESLF